MTEQSLAYFSRLCGYRHKEKGVCVFGLYLVVKHCKYICLKTYSNKSVLQFNVNFFNRLEIFFTIQKLNYRVSRNFRVKKYRM